MLETVTSHAVDQIVLSQTSGVWTAKLACPGDEARPLISFASRADALLWVKRDAADWMRRFAELQGHSELHR